MVPHANYGKARDRLVATAAALVYERGVTASGVDTVVRESGISKPTLYAHFRSKGELVAAAMKYQHAQRRAEVETYLASSRESPARQLLGLFDWLARWHEANGCRGCAFLNAAPELVGPDNSAARAVVRRHKHWWREQIADLAEQAGAAEPEALAEELLILLDGASARVMVENDIRQVRIAQRIAEGVLARAGLNGAA
jgi:AcrR family transcriptional regulator